MSHNLIKLSDYITADTVYNTNINIIEFYLCNKDDLLQSIVDINLSDDYIKNIVSKLKNPKRSSYKSYYMNDKIYTYDLNDDNQIVTSKNKIKSRYIKMNNKLNDLFIVSSRIEKFPPYIFPCKNEIDHICTYSINEYKINNKISIIIREEDDNFKSLYIEYKHSENNELDKMNEILNRSLKNIMQ